MTVRNNLWITMTGDYLWEDTGNSGVPDNWRTSIDYDGFAWPDSTTLPLFKWHDVRYDDLAQLQAATTIEANGVRVPMSCFETLDVPGPSPAVIPPQRVTLADGCNAVDAGEVMANVNDGYVGAGPDLGAHERGATPQHYGPRGDGGTAGSSGGSGSGAGGSAGGGVGGAGTGGASMGGTPGVGGAAGSGGSTSVGGTGASGGSSSGNASSDSSDEGGCGCRSVGKRSASASGLWLLAALALSASRRRRRARC